MPEYSYWIIAGLALIIAEFAVSGLVVIFFGIAAILVGSLKFVGLLDDTTWELTLFALISVLLLVFVRRVLSDKLMGKEQRQGGNEDSAGLIGQPLWRSLLPMAVASSTTVVRAGRHRALIPSSPGKWCASLSTMACGLPLNPGIQHLFPDPF